MALIPSNIDKVNDIEIAADQPLTEALMNKMGANINALIDFLNTTTSKLGTGLIQYQDFTSNGTWVRPAGVDFVFVTGIGGGGGGSAASGGGTGITARSCGGRQGESFTRVVAVVGDVAVTIGQGGAAGIAQNTAGSGGDGGNTTFGGIIFKGGRGGKGFGTYNSGNQLTDAFLANCISPHELFRLDAGEPGWGPSNNYSGVIVPANTGGGGGGGAPQAGGSGRLIVIWFDTKI